MVWGDDPSGLLSCFLEMAIMWASNPFHEWAQSKYSGFVGHTASVATVHRQPKMYVDRWALLGYKRALFAKTHGRLDLAHGLRFADLGWEESEQKSGRGRKVLLQGRATGCVAGRTEAGPEAGFQSAGASDGGGRPQPTEPSQSTLKTIVNKQCWQGPETEISTHRPEDGVCDNDRTQLVGTCPSSRITQTPAASQSHVALQGVWENPE